MFAFWRKKQHFLEVGTFLKMRVCAFRRQDIDAQQHEAPNGKYFGGFSLKWTFRLFSSILIELFISCTLSIKKVDFFPLVPWSLWNQSNHKSSEKIKCNAHTLVAIELADLLSLLLWCFSFKFTQILKF